MELRLDGWKLDLYEHSRSFLYHDLSSTFPVLFLLGPCLLHCVPVPNAKPEYPVLPQALVESCLDHQV